MSQVVPEGDPIAPISDIDDNDDVDGLLGPSDLFRSTMSPDLDQYDDTNGDGGSDADQYYLGREIDYVSAPIVSAGLIDDESVWAGTTQAAIRSWSIPGGTVERDLHLPSSSAVSSMTFVWDHWAVGDMHGRLLLGNGFGEIRADLPRYHDDVISYMTCMSKTSTSLATSSWDGALNILDLDPVQISHHYQPCQCQVDFILPVSSTQIWTAAADGRARFIDIRAKDCVQTVRSDESAGGGAGPPIRCLAMAQGSSSGSSMPSTLYMSFGYGQISAVDLRMGKVLRQYFGHTDVVNRIVLAHDRLISAGDDLEIRIFDIGNCVSIDKLAGHRHEVTNLLVIGASLISSDAEGAVRRYDLETIERFHNRRVTEREQEKKRALDLLAAQQAAAKASTKSKKSKKGSKKKKK